MTDLAPSAVNSGVSRRGFLAGGAGAVATISAAQAQADANPPSLAGKSVLITGASSGFGLLSARHFASLGATVIASMRNFEGGARPEARALADEADKNNWKLQILEIDVTKPAQISAGVAAAEKFAGGRLDVLLNNAGVGLAGPVEIADEAAMEMMFSTNILGYQRMARAVLPKMRETGEGLIVSVSSQLGRLVIPNLGVYCATKFAVEALFEAMAYELAPFGVEATIVQPGGYPTRIWENGGRNVEALLRRADDDVRSAYEAHIALAGGLMSGEQTTDPMDVPRAIAEIIALPAGKRPLRKPVHPNTAATDAMNAAASQVQARVLGSGAYQKWHAAVVD